MRRSPEERVLEKPLPPAWGNSCLAASEADEDKVLTTLAAISRQLNGADSPIQIYRHHCVDEETSTRNVDAKGPAAVSRRLNGVDNPSRNQRHCRNNQEQPAGSADDSGRLENCRNDSTALAHSYLYKHNSYLYKYRYGGETQAI